MKRFAALTGIGIIALAVVVLNDEWPFNRTPSVTSSPTFSMTPGEVSILPGRSTATPAYASPTPPPTVPGAPVVTSPFTFPTPYPSTSPTPRQDCTTVFPLDSVESIDFGQTTIPQLEASFGRATRISGRPSRVRFDESGCTLFVTIGAQEALEAELDGYGTLELLLDHYGTPAAAGISQGNLTLVMTGYTVLLYPDQGAIALFDVGPEELTRATPVSALYFRPAYQVESQVKRLNLALFDWQPPLPE